MQIFGQFSPPQFMTGFWHLPLPLRAIRAVAMATGLLLAGPAGVSTYQRMRQETELAGYRATIQELANAVRSMRTRALATRRQELLRIDASRGVFSVSVVRRQGLHGYERLEETIWLPAGLEVIEAPAVVSAAPNGKLSSASIVIDAPAFHKLFSLTMDDRAGVHLSEESLL